MHAAPATGSERNVPEPPARAVIGIDLGGTAARFVVHGDDGLAGSKEVSTAVLGEGGEDERIDRLVAAIRDQVPSGAVLQAVGIGASGPVDVEAGTIRNPFTLPAFSDIALVAEIEQRLGIPAVLENDALAAAIAENRLGAGMSVDRLLVVTLGTGIGVALILDGKPFRGPNSAHPESGHIPSPYPVPGAPELCYCGARSCWEQSASRKALQRMLRPLFPEAASDREVLALARAAGDRNDVQDALARYGAALGHGLAILHSVYMPEVTVLAGSGARYLDLYRRGLEPVLARAPGFAVDVELRITTLGDTAGAIGAALLARDRAESLRVV
ncbi:MAG TPA: ROK family protein [Dongiaceae bacterium]|nr:ROK family protein [Dongiaceae bacterium]